MISLDSFGSNTSKVDMKLCLQAPSAKGTAPTYVLTKAISVPMPAADRNQLKLTIPGLRYCTVGKADNRGSLVEFDVTGSFFRRFRKRNVVSPFGSEYEYGALQ
jgi:hypothetical protein